MADRNLQRIKKKIIIIKEKGFRNKNDRPLFPVCVSAYLFQRFLLIIFFADFAGPARDSIRIIIDEEAVGG